MRPLRAPTFSAVKRWHRALEKAEATRFAWRKTSASMDLYACPDPHEFAPLFQAAATDWNAIRDPLERALFCGLAVLLIHPLKADPIAYVEVNADSILYTHHTEARGIERYNQFSYPISVHNRHGIGWTHPAPIPPSCSTCPTPNELQTQSAILCSRGAR